MSRCETCGADADLHGDNEQSAETFALGCFVFAMALAFVAGAAFGIAVAS